MRKHIILGVLALALTAAPARADVLLTPFVGATHGGEAPDTRLNYGGALGFMGGGIFGAEIDFSYGPDFFHFAALPGGRSNISTLMFNLILGVPFDREGPGVRPYVAAGAGLMRSRFRDVDEFFDVSANDFGANIGAGLIGFTGQRLGVRADVRYFRNMRRRDGVTGGFDLTGFDYWRTHLGLTVRF